MNANRKEFQPCPDKIRLEVMAAEIARLGLGPDGEDCCAGGVFGYIESLCTDGPGFSGEVVVIVWAGAGPGAITSWGRHAGGSGAWVFQNQTSW